MSAKALLIERKEKAEELIRRTIALKELQGQSKLMRRLVAEDNFLTSLDKKPCDEKFLEGHLKSSNLTHLEAIISTAEAVGDVSYILKKISFDSSSDLVVDVEACRGKLWFKIIARNPFAIHNVWKGLGQFGDKDVCSLAANYQTAARENLVEFREPHIVFLFANSVTRSVTEDLKSMGISVIGQIISDPPENCSRLDEPSMRPLSEHVRGLIKEFMSSKREQSEIEKVNLDITTLIALVSSLTNGNCHYKFEDDVLNSQAKEEKADPVLPKLDAFIKDKQLFVCDTALSDFNNILQTIGGQEEVSRAAKLVDKLTVVRDKPTDRSLDLHESASVKKRSKIIFGTGDSLKAKTTTANRSFVRAAHDQGVDFSVFFHASRALTERKQTKLES